MNLDELKALVEDPNRSYVLAMFETEGQKQQFLEKAKCDEVEKYHHWLYNKAVWQHQTHYLGYKICKTPMDLWSYQELLFFERPELIIETGTAYGGSALYFADLIAPWRGQVMTIDIAESPLPKPVRKNVYYLLGEVSRGGSIGPEIAYFVKQKALDKKTMVVLDSDHSKGHVLKELEIYAPIASYIVVEDSNINGHPVASGFGPGPKEAVEEFLASEAGASWEIDTEWLKHGFSFNTWLRRKHEKDTSV